jgi:hypothetical protein
MRILRNEFMGVAAGFAALLAASPAMALTIAGHISSYASDPTYQSGSKGTLLPNQVGVYQLKITNDGASDLSDVVISYTKPAQFTSAGFAGTPKCTPTGAGDSPCSIGALAAGQEVDISWSAKWDNGVPDVCPVVLDPVVFTATAGTETATANVPSTIYYDGNILNLTVTMTPDKTTASEGDKITYTINITNEGPCAEDYVSFDQLMLVGKTLKWESSDVQCADLAGDGTTFLPATSAQLVDWIKGGAAGCGIGPMAKGDVKTYHETFTVEPMPDGIIQGAVTAGIEVYTSGNGSTGFGTGSAFDWTWDPGSFSDALVQTKVVVEGNNAGCAAVGAAPLAALLAAGLLLRRRRRS